MTLANGYKSWRPAHAPRGIFLDLKVSAAAPHWLSAAGLGDSLCRPTAQVEWWASHRLLGTSYMRLVMENLDNHPVLASAAYNAGPGRAKKWRADRPLEGAIYAESIPFSETRDYVKKVLTNAVYYSVLFNGQPDSLKARLGTINPRSTEPMKDQDLP